jgi:RNA-directed DNA polymerase
LYRFADKHERVALPSTPSAVSLKLAGTPGNLRDQFFALSTRAEVARMLEVPERSLNYILHVRTNNYREFNISKRSGADRRIQSPVRGLKVIQQKLLQVLSAVYTTKTAVHGFAHDKTILSNASAHVRSRFVFNIDILDFFPSINFGRVRGLFMGIPYKRNPEVATLLAQICCYLNGLPQGAPTSPIISNMICAKLDSQLCGLARVHRMSYTRYADDITFSTTKRVLPKPIAIVDPATHQPSAGVELNSMIEANGFHINQKKIRLQTRDQRQRVTGITVNQQPNVSKVFLNQARAMLHSWDDDGLANAEAKFRSKWDRKARRKPDPDFKKVVKGKIDFVGFVKGRDSWAHAKLYWEYCRLDRKFRFRTITATNDASQAVVQETLWVLESESGAAKQGTGVFIKDLGIVTCRHVLEDSTLAYHWREPKRKFETTIVWESEKFDLAIVAIGAKSRAQLGVDRVLSSQTGDAITVYGFPDYKLKQSPVVTPGLVTGRRKSVDVEQILVSSLIVAGSSGGPVLDAKNRLVGIASHGPQDNAVSAERTMSAVTSVQHLPSKL